MPAAGAITRALSFETLMPVADSWDIIKRDPEWQDKFGQEVFRRLFDLAPLSLTLMFPFGGTTMGKKMYQTSEFQDCAREFGYFFDFVITSLGSNMDLVTMQIKELAEQNDKMQMVRPEHWKVLGRALLHALEESFAKDEFTEDLKFNWATVLDSVSAAIMEELQR